MSMIDDAAFEPCGVCGELVAVDIDHCMLRLVDGGWYPAHNECCAACDAESDNIPCETHRPGLAEEAV